MDDFVKKARNYFLLGRIAEKIKMHSEAAANYFKALSAINDLMLKRRNLRASDHSERFLLLKQYFPVLYEISDKMFLVYRRTYTSEIESKELQRLKENVEEAFQYAELKTPTDEEVRKKAQEIS